MGNAKIVSAKVRELENIACDIIEKAISLIQTIPIYWEYDEEYGQGEDLEWGLLEGENKAQRNAILKGYEQWYTSVLQLIKMYLPEKTKEFAKAYGGDGKVEGVVDYLFLEGKVNTNIKDLYIECLRDKFEHQLRLLSCVPGVVEIQELSLRRVISADYAKSELEEAEKLFGMGFYRAAGTIAGVALERHLKTLCDTNRMPYSPNATTDKLAHTLYTAGKFDITEFKQVQFLASIRNKCAHPADVSQSEIESLIEGVKKLTLTSSILEQNNGV